MMELEAKHTMQNLIEKKKKKENESIQKPSPMLKKFSYMVIGVHRFCLKLAIKDY